MGNDKQTTESISLSRSLGGSLAASVTGVSSYVFLKKRLLEKKTANIFFASQLEFLGKQKSDFAQPLQKMYEESALEKKGIRIFDYSQGYPTEVILDVFAPNRNKPKKPKYPFRTLEEYETWANRNPEKLDKMLKEMEQSIQALEKESFESWANKTMKKEHFQNVLNKICRQHEPTLWGLNAFSSKGNVYINFEKMSYALPHELGHAKNYASKGFGKFSNSIYGKSKLLVPLFFATAILRNEKNEGETSDGAIGKGLDFIKDNCVALTAAAYAPTLIEEGLASIKGQKMAKNYLSVGNFKLLKKFNGKAFLTYVGAAVGSILTVFLANKVKNLIS